MVLLSVLLARSEAAESIPGEVDCNRGVDIARVKALVNRTVQALKQDRGKVIPGISHGDARWKDGDYYMFVYQGNRVLAHGYLGYVMKVDATTWAGSGTYLVRE